MTFAYDEQVAAQPAAVADVLARADGVPALDPARPILFVGLGTSWHACRVAAGWMAELTAGRVRPHAIDTHDFLLGPPPREGDQVVVISHGGGRLAREALALSPFAVAVVGKEVSVPAAFVLHTCAPEKAGTHTVSYTSALAMLALLVDRTLGGTLGGTRLGAALPGAPDALRAALALSAADARPLVGRERVLVAGVGADAITAAEAALKLAEATRVWARGLGVEQAIHGPVAALDARAAAIVIPPPFDDGGRAEVLRRKLGERGVTLVEVDLPACDPLLRPLVGIVPFQRLVAELARLTGGDPDAIHRTD